MNVFDVDVDVDVYAMYTFASAACMSLMYVDNCICNMLVIGERVTLAYVTGISLV